MAGPASLWKGGNCDRSTALMKLAVVALQWVRWIVMRIPWHTVDFANGLTSLKYHCKRPWIVNYHFCMTDLLMMFFSVFNCESEAVAFFSKLNTMHDKCRFTMEREVSGELPFMDVLLTKVDGKLCRYL